MPPRLLLSALLALAPACARPGDDTPEGAYAAFARAAERGEAQEAFAGLSERAQQALAARAQDVVRVSGGAVGQDPAALIFSSPWRPSPVTEVKVERTEGDTAFVRATTAAQEAAVVRMVREGGRWRVDAEEPSK